MSKAKVAAVLIAGACALCAPVVMKWEGLVLKTYRDPLPGYVLLTNCWGHTGPDVKAGQIKTLEECKALLDADLRRHAEGVAECAPEITDKPKIFASALSLAFNVGVKRWCDSTAAKRFRAGNYRGGCEAQSWFNRAGGKVLKGLVRRRQDELKLCLEGVAEWTALRSA